MCFIIILYGCLVFLRLFFFSFETACGPTSLNCCSLMNSLIFRGNWKRLWAWVIYCVQLTHCSICQFLVRDLVLSFAKTKVWNHTFLVNYKALFMRPKIAEIKHCVALQSKERDFRLCQSGKNESYLFLFCTENSPALFLRMNRTVSKAIGKSPRLANNWVINPVWNEF